MQLKQLVRKDVLFRYRYIYPLYSVHYLVLLLKKPTSALLSCWSLSLSIRIADTVSFYDK